VKLTAEMIEAFSGVYLSPRYDQPQPTPDFHRECWGRYCSDHPAAATAAPRNHAKSTGLTHDFILANVCFRVEDYVILIGASEEMAIEHLTDIATELRENDELIRDFKIKEFVSDQKTDIIVECLDGYRFRIIARGAEQKIRGRKWKGKRPGLIVGDDLEDDEQVENKERRRKFRRWFFRAAKQALRDGGRIRVHGTILHKDSLLSHLIRNKGWLSKLYKAHKGFSDFTQILWPEKFPEARLRAIRQEFIDEGDSAGYSQEYLNDPKDDEGAYFLPNQFVELTEDHLEDFRTIAIGWDFAVSKADAANRTSATVGGRTADNFTDFLAFHAGRWGTDEWIDLMFDLEQTHTPYAHYVEDGVIWKSVWPAIRSEMARRDIWLNIVTLPSTKDKAARGQSWRKRMRAGWCRFNKSHPGYAEFEEECLDFSMVAEADLDDQFDSGSILVRGLEDVSVDAEDEMTDDEQAFDRESERLRSYHEEGRSPVTGY